MRVRLTYLYVLIFVISYCKSQINQQQFLKDFNNADIKNKVRLVANTQFENIKNIYPQIKDTLDVIKRLIYNNTESKEAKYLFDIIESNEALYNGNYAKAIYILGNCLENHTQNVSDSIKCLVLLKSSLINIQDYIKAFEANRLIEKILPRVPNNKLVDIGKPKSSLYNLIGLTKEAIKYRRIEFAKNYSAKDSINAVSFYNDLGVFYNQLKNTDSAEFYFFKAKQLLNAIKVPYSKTVFYTFFKGLIDGNIGNCYFISGQVKGAIPYLKNDIYSSLLSNNYESAANAYALLSRCYIKLNDEQLAKRYIDSTNSLISKQQVGNKVKLNFLLLNADYHNFINEHKKASENYLTYINLKDSINNSDKERQLLNEEVAFNLEQKEIEIAEKNNTLEQNKLYDAKQKTFRAYLLAGVLMLLGVIVILILNNRYVKTREEELAIKNSKINQQNTLIEQSLKEKELLIKEIHHRVKNNLQIITSMLSLQIGKISDEKTEAILREAKQRISSIALTHQMLYQKNNFSNLILGEYVERLVQQIETTLPNTYIELVTNIHCKDKRVSVDNAVPLGLLINEALTNSYKHAFPNNKSGIVNVNLIDYDSYLILTIADNGIGLPTNIDNSNNQSMGMELIYILAEQLDANLKVESNSGTKIILELKKLN